MHLCTKVVTSHHIPMKNTKGTANNMATFQRTIVAGGNDFRRQSPPKEHFCAIYLNSSTSRLPPASQPLTMGGGGIYLDLVGPIKT